MSNRHLLTVAVVAVLSSTAYADTIYVDADNCPGPGNGTPADPYCSIQLAIIIAVDTDEIVVAPGTYLETINFLGKGVTLRSSDGPEVTIIDGQQVGSVVTCFSGEGPDTILDGFTVTNGLADNGGGMTMFGSSPTVTNCIFTSNNASRGGGMLADWDSSPTVTNCIFTSNGGEYGGGMYNAYGSHSTVTNCIFAYNSVVWFGGGMDNKQSDPTVTNCTFKSNLGYFGGGMFNEDNSSPTVTNCTFTSNVGDYGGGMYSVNSSPSLTNCILWGDALDEILLDNSTITVTYSDVQGGWTGTNNIDADPMFADTDGRLSPGSPCIDSANNAAVLQDITTDLDGNPRFVDDPDSEDCWQAPGTCGDPPIVDMGAYEFQGTTPFAVLVEGQLQAVSGDPHDLDGASLLVAYSADTTDTATDTGSGSGYAYSFFDVFTMEVTITNRPNSAPDITGLTVPNDPIVHNHFPPGEDNDDLTFDSRDFAGVPGIGGQGCLSVHLLFIDFGSQTFFPGDDSVTDLSFFEPLIGSDLAGGFLGYLSAGDCFYGDEYDVTGTTITVVGEGADEIGFDPPEEFSADGEPNKEAIGDLDGNETTDVVTVLPNEDPQLNGDVQVFLNQGTDPDGVWLGLVQKDPVPVGRDPGGVAVGRLNADVHLDVAVSNTGDNTVSVLFNAGTGNGDLLPAVDFDAGSQPSAIVADDFNEDGFVDLAVTSVGDQTVVVLFNDGEGDFSGGEAAAPVALNLALLPFSLASDDLDDNKDPDLTGSGAGSPAAGEPGVVFVLLGQPGGSFEPAVLYDVGLDPQDITTGDLDLDGYPDLATANTGDATVSILLNQGDGTFLTMFTQAVGANPQSVEAVDLNGDFDRDLAVVAEDPEIGPAVQVLANRLESGELVFDEDPDAFGVSADPNFVVSADFNDDGLADLVTVNADDGETDGSVTVLLADPIPVSPPVAFDIKPGACPNPLNINSQGVLPTALVSKADFDVTQVVLESVRLSRATGGGGTVAPLEGPPGPHSEFDDVATPLAGEPCDCHELGGDGILDLAMKFKTQDVVEALGLDGVPGGESVEFVISGTLLDGTEFAARDCVRLVPPSDIDGDGAVGVADLLGLLAAWGPCPDPPADCLADIDGDGNVGATDFLTLLANWGPCF
jgi:hypothetical protein